MTDLIVFVLGNFTLTISAAAQVGTHRRGVRSRKSPGSEPGPLCCEARDDRKADQYFTGPPKR